MVSRTKRKFIFPYEELTDKQLMNSFNNVQEMENRISVLTSYPRRVILELTNACNLRCEMCGRCHTTFNIETLPMMIVRWLEPIFEEAEEVTLMGWGEPTLYPQFPELLRLLNRHSARKYICTNGSQLRKISPLLFDCRIDLFAVSINGVTPATNDHLRRGSKINTILQDLHDLAAEKERRKSEWPVLSLVFCLSHSNRLDLYELPDKAADLGINRIKIVYMTAFSSELEAETILNCIPEIKDIFIFMEERCELYGIELELPFLPGEDPAGEKSHHDCTLPWRDLFIGSDGWVRPCMSTADKLFKIDTNRSFMEQWNHDSLRKYRRSVNRKGYMPETCQRCYHASFCNWNMKHSFSQCGQEFAPIWKK